MIILSDASQKEKAKYHMISLICGILNTTKEHIYENRNRLRYKNRLVVAKGEGVGGGKDWEFGVSRGKPLYIEWINNKVLLYSTGNYIQYPVTNHSGKEYIYIYIYIYMCVCVCV